METLLDALTSAAAVATVGALLGALSALALSMRAARTAQKATAQAKLVHVLKADNFDKLGEFLVDDLGSVGLGTYLRDSRTRDQFRVALGRVEDYLAPDSGTSTFWPLEAPENVASHPEDPPGQLEAEISKAVDGGEYWNALARLRRALERRLKEIGPAHGPRSSLASLVRTATKSGVVDEETRRIVEEFIPVANQAIHGEDVEPRTALQAIDLGLTALSRLQE